LLIDLLLGSCRWPCHAARLLAAWWTSARSDSWSRPRVFHRVATPRHLGRRTTALRPCRFRRDAPHARRREQNGGSRPTPPPRPAGLQARPFSAARVPSLAADEWGQPGQAPPAQTRTGQATQRLQPVMASFTPAAGLAARPACTASASG